MWARAVSRLINNFKDAVSPGNAGQAAYNAAQKAANTPTPLPLAGAEVAPIEALASERAQGNVVVPTAAPSLSLSDLSTMKQLQGGQPVPTPPPFQATMPLNNDNVMSRDYTMTTGGGGGATTTVQPQPLTPEQARQFLIGQSPFIRPQDQGIGALFNRLLR